MNLIMLKNNPQVVFNDLRFDKDGVIIEDYDLHQLEIKDIHLSWPPYTVIEDCNENGSKCKTVIGILPELVKTISKKLNFTWTSVKDPSDDWGVLPKDGTPYDLHLGKWGGVMGNVVTGDFHTSFTDWFWTIQREPILDFIIFCTDSYLLAYSPKPPAVDIGLFIRPFRNESWYWIIGMMLLLILLLLLPYIWRLGVSWEDTQSFQITKTAGWIFFLLLNAFYGGAMTMFFASEPPLPFNTLREAMQSFPGK